MLTPCSIIKKIKILGAKKLIRTFHYHVLLPVKCTNMGYLGVEYISVKNNTGHKDCLANKCQTAHYKESGLTL